MELLDGPLNLVINLFLKSEHHTQFPKYNNKTDINWIVMHIIKGNYKVLLTKMIIWMFQDKTTILTMNQYNYLSFIHTQLIQMIQIY